MLALQDIKINIVPGCRSIKITAVPFEWTLETDAARKFAEAIRTVADIADRKAEGTQ
jgi:hypothetical protein